MSFNSFHKYIVLGMARFIFYEKLWIIFFFDMGSFCLFCLSISKSNAFVYRVLFQNQ